MSGVAADSATDDAPAARCLPADRLAPPWCVVSHEHRFIWFAIPKNASTTIRLELEQPRYAAEPKMVEALDPAMVDGYTTFAMLRDPLVRCLSAYQEVSYRGDLYGNPDGLDFHTLPPGLDRFGRFLDTLEKRGPWDGHVAAQSDRIPVESVDLFGDVANLEVELAWIMHKLGFEEPPALNRHYTRVSRRETRGYDRHLLAPTDLTAELIGRVRDIYRADSTLFKQRIVERPLDRDYLIVDRGSDLLLVSFGGRGEGYNFMGLAERLGADGLFFRDSADEWYQNGVRGLSTTFADVGDFIRRVMSSRARSHVLFIGQSSGGYAALRFAHELEPDSCLAFAPQTHALPFDTPLPRRYPEGARHVPPAGIDDVAELYRSRSPRTRVEVHACSSEVDNPPEQYLWDDDAHLDALADIDAIDITRHPCSYHPVTYHLSGTGELDHIARSIIAGP